MITMLGNKAGVLLEAGSLFLGWNFSAGGLGAGGAGEPTHQGLPN